MKKFIIALSVGALALAGFSTTASAGSENAAPKGKVTICHRTGSETNPYVRINVSVNALKNAGHGTVNLALALETIGTLNPGYDLAAFVDIGGHEGDIFLIDQENEIPCPDTPDAELVSANVCLDGELISVGPSFEADVDAEVARLVELGATEGDCPSTCDDFATAAELTAYLDSLSVDARAALLLQLDADGDGAPCETITTTTTVNVVEETPEVPVVPETPVVVVVEDAPAAPVAAPRALPRTS